MIFKKAVSEQQLFEKKCTIDSNIDDIAVSVSWSYNEVVWYYRFCEKNFVGRTL